MSILDGGQRTVAASTLKPGRYMCVRTGGWLAWLIRKATRSRVNHTVIIGPGGDIVEATPRGVHKARLSDYAGMYAVANADEPMTDEQGMEIWSAALGMAGDGYDFADLPVLGLDCLGWHWNLLFRILGVLPWRICSQAAVMAGAVCVPPMVWLCGKLGADQVTPADLARRPGMRRVVWDTRAVRG